MKKSIFALGVFSYYSFDLWDDIYKSFYIPLPNHLLTYGLGSFALITGASDGIGKAFATTLAAQGFNIILVSRDHVKLDSLASELRSKYQIQTLVHPLDLSKATEFDFQNLVQATSNLDVSILINNAGMVQYKKNEEISYADINETVNLNALAVVRLMHLYLPQLSKREPKSAVINVSSITAVRPVPILCLYSATKAFVHYMTVGLSEEYSEKIDIMSYMPAGVSTKMAIDPNTPVNITPTQAVTECLKDLGRKRVSYGHYKHTLIAYITELLPQPLRLKISSAGIAQAIEALNNSNPT